jgi:hypothetical protein
MEVGENEQARFCGKPEHAKVIALLKDPELGAAVTVTFPDPPEEIVNAEGLVANVKLVPAVVVPPPVVLVWQLAENFTGLDIWFVMLGFPTACTYNV